MKKYGATLLTMFLLLMVAQSCRERNPNDANGDRLQEMEERRQQDMDRHEEWSGTDEMEEDRDSMDQGRDSTNRDTTKF